MYGLIITLKIALVDAWNLVRISPEQAFQTKMKPLAPRLVTLDYFHQDIEPRHC